MSILKSEEAGKADSADSGRRSFFWKLGAGASAALASTAGLASSGRGHAEDLSLRLARLEEEKALRELHQRYESAMDRGAYEEVLVLFAEDAEVLFGGEVFRGRSHGLSLLFGDRFRSGKTGKRMEAAPGFELDAGQQQERVDIAPDRRTASAVLPFSVQVGTPIETETSLAQMAKLHGEGVRTWWEGGVYDISYLKDADGRWKIRRLEYRTLSRADYRAGRSYATALPA